MNIFKQQRGTGILLIVVAVLSFVAARVTHTLPVGSVVWADSARVPHAMALSPETSGPTLEVGPSQSPSTFQGVGTETVGEPATGIDPSMSMLAAGALSSPSLQFHDQARPGGLTVSAVGSVIRPADEAYIIVVPDPYYGVSGPEPLSSEDKKDVIESLAELGIEESAVEFIRIGRYEPTTIAVEVEVEDVSAKATQVIEAVEEVVRQTQAYGVRYVLSSEHCHQALALARRQAIPGAHQAADDLAAAFGAELGSVTSVLEYPVNGDFNRVRVHTDGCRNQSIDPYTIDVMDMVSLDAKPEVTVLIGLQVTYSLQ